MILKKAKKKRVGKHKRKFENGLFPKKRSVLEKVNMFYIALLLFVSFLCIVVYLFFFSSLYKIKEIKISGISTEQTQDVYEIILNQFDSRRYIIFPQDTLYIFNHKELQNQLDYLFPKYSIAINIDENKHLQVSFLEKSGVLKWVRNNTIYLLDTQGNILRTIEQYLTLQNDEEQSEKFELSLHFENDLLPMVFDQSTSTSPQESKIIDEKNIELILHLHALLKNYNALSITSYNYKSDIGKNISAITPEGIMVHFILNDKISLEKQVIRLRLLKDNKFNGDFGSNIDYIDMRNSEKIYFKEKSLTIEE